MTNPLNLDFDGATAVVIGGNQGLGASIAMALAEARCQVVIAARNSTRLSATRAEIEEKTGARVRTKELEITSDKSIDLLGTYVLETFGPPSILVNGAGGTVRKPIFDVTPDDWDAVIGTHLRGTFFVSQLFGRAMVAEGYGKIINMSSTWATTYAPNRSLYATAKAGVSHLTAAMAIEWAPNGVCVNAIAPTATLTPRVAKRFSEDPASEEVAASRIPKGRLAEPSDVIGAALFLSSSASDYITGQTLYVDGGWQYSK